MTPSLMPITLNGAALAAAWVLSVYALLIQKLVVRRIRESEHDTAFGWWIGGAICLGTGIWAETLITVLSIELPIKHGHLLSLVVGSWVPAVGLWGIVLWLNSHQRISWPLRAMGILLISVGCTSLVCMSVSTILLRPAVHWDVWTVLLGFGLLVAITSLASGVLRRTWAGAPSLVSQVFTAVVLGSLFRAAQIVVVHAAGFPVGAQSLTDDFGPGAQLVPIVAGVALLLFVLVHMGASMDENHQTRQAQLKASLAQARDDLEHASYRDHLTRLNNRQGFDAQLQKALDEGSARLAVMLINLDGFRSLMNHFGHVAGDDVLRQVGARLRLMMRTEDVVARADGDEFLLLLKTPGDAHAMTQLAQRVNDTLAQPYMLAADDIELTCSVGVAMYPDQPNPMRLVDHANEAMLAARAAGGGVYCLYQEGMGRSLEPLVALQRDLRHAIERQQLMLYYQPKIDAHNGQLSGVEALLRWKHPVRGMVSPVEFIPVAERFGLIGELGHWVLREACRQVRAWLDAGIEIHVAVNVSVHQLRQSDLGEQVRQALNDQRVPPHMLVLEITESVAMENIESSLKMFDLLDAIGVQLSIDDFGTGYSSLSYLRRLPAKQLKVDRCFVKDLDNLVSHDARAIVEAVVRLSHALGLKVVAEGVETHAQAQALRELGCDEFQGFLFARPMPEFELLAWQVERETGARLAPHGPISPIPELSLPQAGPEITQLSTV